MKIILVVTNTCGKNLVFVSDLLKTLSLDEAIRAADKGLFQNVYSVNGISGAYLRSTPNISEKDNLDTLSVTAADIIAYANRARHFQSTDAISMYTAHYISSLLESGVPFIETTDGDKAFVDRVRETITDEVVRLGPFEDIRDVFLLNLLGRNVSVGIAQVKLETANNVTKKGLYNPNPKDKKLPFRGVLSNKDREYLYRYVVEPNHNIRFAAAYIRDIINVWAKYIDLTKRPEIIATLYSKGYGDPKSNPITSKRGMQIVEEFYPLVKKWISNI